MKWSELVALGKRLPEVEEGLWYGTPALKVRGKGFVRLREDDETVVFVLSHIGEQQALIEAQPDLFFITDHYRRSAAVLARLADLRKSPASWRLEQAWRAKAPKTLVRELED